MEMLIGFHAEPLNHLLALLLLVSRVGDVASTRLVTPTLRLEANPLVRRLGWPFALATLLVALVPYVSTAGGVMLIPPFLLVTASNLSRVWLARSLGEEELNAVLRRAVSGGSLRDGVRLAWLSAAFIALAGGVLMALSDGLLTLPWWFGQGIVAYGFVVAFHGTGDLKRRYRRAAKEAVT